MNMKYLDLIPETAKGHNLMAENTDADIMMIMNPDVILEPTCLWELMEPLKLKEVEWWRQDRLRWSMQRNIIQKQEKRNGHLLPVLCLKTEVYNKINGFDAETFFLYCDDLDFSWRVRLAGYKIIYMPSAIVYHAKNLSLSGTWQPTSAEIYYSAEAAMLLAYKWSNPERAESFASSI